ncbi:MAG: tRNA uracil 4-sulfurtransferase ThiI [Candidatus Enteromonas sp.]|nr:tRNA uracil 4-sulfurtransferase ThiI [Candidatus Enteromonas sp.]
MKYDSLLIHYGELSTKGNNRSSFIDRLTHNIRVALSSFPTLEVKGNHDFCAVYLHQENHEAVVARLQEISGIQKISLVAQVGRSVEEIAKAALELLQNEEGTTFKIDVKRVDKSYPLDSYSLACQVADYLLDHSSLQVDLHHYDILLRITVREKGVYLSCHEFLGLGGYPLGMNGKAGLLLSGGIDSPVAAYSLLRRGILVEGIHFASPPYTSERVIDKLTDLLGALTAYQPSFRLHIVPFTKIQEAIYEHVPEPYCITIMRRMMLRLAERVAKTKGCLALATGESIGQVASQTLDSLYVINEVTNYPILRPLATSDKLSIINTAKRIGTYEISIRPFEDCCTIFKPKKPKTKPKLDDCLYYESKWDYASQIEEAVQNIQTIRVPGGSGETCE